MLGRRGGSAGGDGTTGGSTRARVLRYGRARERRHGPLANSDSGPDDIELIPPELAAALHEATALDGADRHATRFDDGASPATETAPEPHDGADQHGSVPGAHANATPAHHDAARGDPAANPARTTYSSARARPRRNVSARRMTPGWFGHTGPADGTISREPTSHGTSPSAPAPHAAPAAERPASGPSAPDRSPSDRIGTAQSAITPAKSAELATPAALSPGVKSVPVATAGDGAPPDTTAAAVAGAASADAAAVGAFASTDTTASRPSGGSTRALPATDERAARTAVWPYGALFAGAGVVMGAYAYLDSPPAWINRTVEITCGTDPSAAHALLLGAVLVVMGRGIAGRRRVSWALALGLLTWSALTEVEAAAVHDPGEPWRLVPLLIIAAGLLRARDGFTVPPDRRRLRQSVVTAAFAGAVLLFIGGGSLMAERDRFAEPKSTMGLGRALVAAAAANYGPGDFDGPGWLLPTLALAAGGALVVVLWWLNAPSPPPAPGGSAERAAMRALVGDPGSDSLAPFALRYDKAFVFSPDRRAAVGYRVLAGAAVVGGDPVGAPEAWGAAIDAFLDRAERHGWRAAVIGAGPRGRQLWAERGMHGIGIGDEVVVDAESFSLSGRSMRNVRQAVRRSENAGIEIAVVPERKLPPALAAELRAIHRAWLGRGRSRGREHGFAMNLDAMAEGRHPDALLFIAFAQDGYAVSFQRYLPSAGAGANAVLSLDVMPRDRVAPNGVTERLIVTAIEYAAANGYAAVSLNFAAFRPLLEKYRLEKHQSGKAQGASLGVRSMRRVVRLLDPLIQVESLYRFNAKFQPGWTPRAVMMQSWFDLPRFAVAAFGLEFGLPYDRGRSRPGGMLARVESHAVPAGVAMAAAHAGSTAGGEADRAEEQGLGILRSDGHCYPGE